MDLKTRLDQCILYPGDTWLQPDLIVSFENDNNANNNNVNNAAFLDQMDTSLLESVVTRMVACQTDLSCLEEQGVNTDSPLLTMLIQAKQQIDDIVQASQLGSSSTIIADYLTQQLIYGGDIDNTDNTEGGPILLQLEVFEQEWKVLMEEKQEDALLQQEPRKQEKTALEQEPAAVSYFATRTTQGREVQPQQQQQEVMVEPVQPYVAGAAAAGPQVVQEEVVQEAVVAEPEPIFAAGPPPQIRLEDVTFQDVLLDDDDDDDDDVIIATKFIVEEEVEVADVNVMSNSNYDYDYVATIAEIVDVIPDVVVAAEGAARSTVFDPQQQQQEDFDFMRRVTAELVTDDDFDVAVGQAKKVETAPERLNDDGDDDDEQQQDTNPVVQFTLRSLDVVFLVIEKTVMVRNERGAMQFNAMPVCQ
jgi:hypothetical protein